MNWIDVNDRLPQKDGLYMISVWEPMFRFQDTDGTIITCEELKYTRCAKLQISEDGVRHWEFLSYYEDIYSLEGEITHAEKGEFSIIDVVDGCDDIIITAWAEMPEPYQGGEAK